MNVTLRKEIVNSFKLAGLRLRSEASDLLTETLGQLEPCEREEWIEKIIDYLSGEDLDMGVVERNQVEAAVLDSCKQEDPGDEMLTVLSAWQLPRYAWSRDRKKFLARTDVPQLFDGADGKAAMFRDRYELLYQVITRNNLFQDLAQDGSHYKLMTVEWLLSRSGGKAHNILVMGLLTQLQEGRYHLEDPTGAVPLDLSSTFYHEGLFTDGSYVLAEGSLSEGVLRVRGLSLPPREPADISRSYFSGREVVPSERSRRDTSFVLILAEVFLDRPLTMEKLQILLNRYSEVPPYAIVLCGNFLSHHKGAEHYSRLKEGFRALAELMGTLPRLAASVRLVLVPGPTDTPAPNILPRPCLPSSLVDDLRTVVPHLHLTTSPCRLKLSSREMVVVREDLVTKLCRNTLHYPTTGKVHHQAARTLICQATLAPLPLTILPVYWAHASALSLYPTPDLLVVADRPHQPFSTTYNHCHVLNPGVFSKGPNFPFKVYHPSNHTVDDCELGSLRP